MRIRIRLEFPKNFQKTSKGILLNYIEREKSNFPNEEESNQKGVEKMEKRKKRALKYLIKGILGKNRKKTS